MFRGEGYWEATRPSSWFWPLGLPHPVCVSTIFALYNRPLYIIKPPSPGPESLCLEGRRGSVHGSRFQGCWGSACQSQAQRALGTRPASIIFLGEEVEGWASLAVVPSEKKLTQERRRVCLPTSCMAPRGSAGHPGGPWDSSPVLTSTQVCGVQAGQQGRSCPPQAPPQASPWAQLTVCTGLREMDGLRVPSLPARRLRGPSSWGKSPRAVSWGIQGLARGGRMWKPQPLSSPLLLWIRQGEDHTKGLDPSWPRSRTVPAPQPRPGGLPSHCMWSGSSVPGNKCHEARMESIKQTGFMAAGERAVEPCLAAN